MAAGFIESLSCCPTAGSSNLEIPVEATLSLFQV
jgi:hypothetical protein